MKTAKHFTLTAVHAIPAGRLELAFADGAVMGVNVSPLIARHPTLARLAEPGVFAQASVGEWGASVTWAKDDNLELAADNLRARAIEQAGGVSHEFVWNWMARHGFTLDTAAQALGNIAAATLPALPQATLDAVAQVYDQDIRPHVHQRW